MILAFLGGLEVLFLFLFGGLIVLLCFAFWLWMLIDSLTNNGLDASERVVWVLVIVLLPFIGSILYLFLTSFDRRPAAAICTPCPVAPRPQRHCPAACRVDGRIRVPRRRRAGRIDRSISLRTVVRAD